VLLIVSPKTKRTASAILADLVNPLQFLFAMRVTNHDLKFGLGWIDHIEKFLRLESGSIRFNEAEFTKRYLLTRVPAYKVKQFRSRLADLRSSFRGDPRFQIRGHDFIKIFTWYLKKGEHCNHLNGDSVRQMLYASLRPESLAKEHLFATLLERVSR